MQVVPYLPKQLDQLHDPSYGHTRPSWTELRRQRAQHSARAHGSRQRAAAAAAAGPGAEGAPPVYLQHLRAGGSASALLGAAISKSPDAAQLFAVRAQHGLQLWLLALFLTCRADSVVLLPPPPPLPRCA